MPPIVKISGNFINLDAIRFVEYSTENPPVVIVHWTNGQKRIFRNNDANQMYQTLVRATLFESSPT
jgi:hypothetical protein